MTTEPKSSKSKPASPCLCMTAFAYTITRGDTPETLEPGEDPNEVVDTVYGSCGQTTHRTFAPGHDAKLKGLLLRLARAGQEYVFFDGGLLVHASPVAELDRWGWTEFLVELKPRAKRERKGQKPRKSDSPDAVTKVKAFTSDTAGDLAPAPGFHPVRVKVGRWVYDGQIVASQGNGDLVSVEYVNGKGETKAAQVKANQIVG